MIALSGSQVFIPQMMKNTLDSLLVTITWKHEYLFRSSTKSRCTLGILNLSRLSRMNLWESLPSASGRCIWDHQSPSLSSKLKLACHVCSSRLFANTIFQSLRLGMCLLRLTNYFYQSFSLVALNNSVFLCCRYFTIYWNKVEYPTYIISILVHAIVTWCLHILLHQYHGLLNLGVF